jgi:hypothetical protein
MTAWVAAGAVLALGLIGPAIASAFFHLVQIREIYTGAAGPGAEYVELQMWAGGQELVTGHKVRTYDAAGVLTGTSTFTDDVARGSNQSTILLATAAAEEQFGVLADLSLATSGLSPAGGAVCWENLDCVVWGSFKGSLPSPAGSPATPEGIADGFALRRTIARGCATALDPQDDTNDSAADFATAGPDPRPNSVVPSEAPCSSGGSGAGGGSPQSGKGAPQTTLRRKPPKRSTDRTPTFRFTADEAGARFQCKLDGKRFRACRSPFTTKALTFGAHTFRVRAIDSDGQTDTTPAVYRFTVLRRTG